MKRGNIQIDNAARYSLSCEISPEKLDNAIRRATNKLLVQMDIYADKFPGDCSRKFKYPLGENSSWTQGMYTGCLLMAYELTSNEKFLDSAKSQMPSYQKRLDEEIGVKNHDVGFVYTPSVVAYYKLTGDKEARELALSAARYHYQHNYSQKGGFIIRASGRLPAEDACRTMMDTLMNIPLFFWAYEETGDKKFYDAACSQLDITEKYLIRPDGSSFHHYQFDPQDHTPVRGLTFQGHSDDSCWSRGHAWGVYGFPAAYNYTKDNSLINLHRDVSYFMLNHLPTDNIPYYDYDFVEMCDEARDSSAGLISACGMLEMSKHLNDEEEKKIYQNAANMMIDAVIDNCTDYEKMEFDGLVRDVTCSAPHNLCINGCAMYGDYFYLEALMRLKNPEWKMHW